MIEIKKTLKTFVGEKTVVKTIRNKYFTSVVAENEEAAKVAIESNGGTPNRCADDMGCEKRSDAYYGGSSAEVLNIEETITIKELE